MHGSYFATKLVGKNNQNCIGRKKNNYSPGGVYLSTLSNRTLVHSDILVSEAGVEPQGGLQGMPSWRRGGQCTQNMLLREVTGNSWIQEPGSGGILKMWIWMRKNIMTRVTGISGSSYLRVIEGPCLGLAGKVTLEGSWNLKFRSQNAAAV